jgi:uncharacterized membrane protein
MISDTVVPRHQFDKKSLIFYGFITIYSILLLYLCRALNIWEDEAYSLHTSLNKLVDVIRLSYHFEDQPPGYFILLSLWRLISPSIFFARLFSVLCIAAAAYVFYLLERTITNLENARWIVVIFLLNPFTVWAALEIRTYALLIFLTILAIYVYLKYYSTHQKKYLYSFLLICLIGLYTQYFFAILVAAIAFTTWIFKGWKEFFKLSLYLLIVVILFLPNLYFIFDQLAGNQTERVGFSMSRQFIAVLISTQNFLLALDIAPFENLIRWLLKFSLIAFLLFTLIRYLKKTRGTKDPYFQRFNYLLVLFPILLFLFCCIIAISGIVYQFKYLTITFPLFILLFGIFKVYPSKFINLFFSALVVYFTALLILNYDQPIKKQDYRSAAAYVKRIEKSNEPILFYSKSILPPFSHYYSGNNELVPLVPLIYDQEYYENDIKDTTEIKGLIMKIRSESRSYVLVNDTIRGYRYTPRFSNKVFDHYLECNFRITLDTVIPGNGKDYYLRIRRLHLPG